ncbi:MAG: VCBS repeat-containing protein [Deltaproteobacteria bacterium]|nr:VCBS repeat-containing protein [Deltaproteobacteria bacterium]MBP7291989.1 VCBS repeat-containing protein [Nannocystaceae bacterium]
MTYLGKTCARWSIAAAATAIVSAGCGGDPPANTSANTTDASMSTSGSSSGNGTTSGDGTGTGTSGSTSTATTQADSDTGTIFDVGVLHDAAVDTTEPPSCKVVDDMDAVGDCSQQAPADSFEPEVQWAWDGENGDIYSVVTPLVANLTEDNGDGEIDLCDIPDVVVVAYADLFAGPGHIYVLDGATGSSHFQIPTAVDPTVCPALGDIDGDGLPEIVSVMMGGALVAFEHDGSLKWQSNDLWGSSYIAALALADLDNDGDVEIVAGGSIYDHDGALVAFTTTPPQYSASTAADLDDDGDLELVLGNAAYHHDGTLLWNSGIDPGFPQVANFDDDPEPEILVTNQLGLAMLEHDGAVVFQNLTPTGDSGFGLTWFRPATVHDFDGDGEAEFAVSSANNYTVYEADASIVWSATVSDQSGVAAGTAFDFLGDGGAEAMYADEANLFVFDDMGDVLLQSPRTSLTGTEYPVVVDVDNDGSAEIVVVSNQSIGLGGGSPPVQVIRDVDERWIQARRIWNQHAYHVTNVREDGTIPQHEPKSWQQLNTFRTNAQIEGGGVCMPQPRG